MIFIKSASSAAVLVFDLPLCTHTDTEGKPRGARMWKIFQNLRKKIFNAHPVLELPRFMNRPTEAGGQCKMLQTSQSIIGAI